MDVSFEFCFCKCTCILQSSSREDGLRVYILNYMHVTLTPASLSGRDSVTQSILEDQVASQTTLPTRGTIEVLGRPADPGFGSQGTMYPDEGVAPSTPSTTSPLGMLHTLQGMRVSELANGRSSSRGSLGLSRLEDSALGGSMHGSPMASYGRSSPSPLVSSSSSKLDLRLTLDRAGFRPVENPPPPVATKILLVDAGGLGRPP